jgi:hypothetical protein
MIRLTLIASACVIVAACATPTQSTPQAYPGCVTWEKQAGTPELAPVSVLSPELAKVIGVREINVSRTGTGMAAVQATVYNCTDFEVVLTMRTRFNGDRGQSEPPSAYKTVHLPARAQVTYGENAVSQATKQVAVDIHDANRGQSQFAPGQNYAAPKSDDTQK